LKKSWVINQNRAQRGLRFDFIDSSIRQSLSTSLRKREKNESRSFHYGR
jgi:hypothetical protein